MKLKRMISTLTAAVIGFSAPLCFSSEYSHTIGANVMAAEAEETTYDTWQEAYRAVLYENESEDRAFQLYDINQDGTPELFISMASYGYKVPCWIYAFIDNKPVHILSAGNYGYSIIDLTHNYVVGGASHMGLNEEYYYSFDGREVSVVISFVENNYGDTPIYKVNDIEVTEAEYKNAHKEYDSIILSDDIGREHSFDDLFYQAGDINYEYYFDYYEAFYVDFDSTAATISIPNTVNNLPVKKVGSYFLWKNNYVRTVNIPANVEDIDAPAFINSLSLTAINIDSGNPNYTSKDGVLYNKDMTKLVQFPTAKDASDYTFPESVTEIDEFAFSWCTGVKKIELPETVDTIWGYAFYCCPNLSSITFLNPYCDLYDYWDSGDGVTICNSYDDINEKGSYLGVIQGYDDSYAERYAEVFDRTFISLGAYPDATTTTTTTVTTTATTTTTITTTTPPDLSEAKFGDPNRDGLIDAVDASYILALYAKISTSSETPTDYEWATCDINSDGFIDAVDASTILSYYAYISTGGTQSLKEFMRDMNDTSNTTTTTTATTTTTTTTTTTQSPQFDIYDYPEYSAKLAQIKSLIETGGGYNDFIRNDLSVAYSYESEKGFVLIDLNDDGMPELLTISGEMSTGASAIAEIYTIYRGELVRLCCAQDRLSYYLCENNVIGSSGRGSANSGGMAYSKYTFGRELDTIGYLSYEYTSSGNILWTYNDNEITVDEAHEIQNKYKDAKADATPLSDF